VRRPVTITLRPRLVARPLVAVALAVAVALSLGACMVFNPFQTMEPYQPADGVGVRIGEVAAIGLVVVTPSKGAVGVLTGSVVNQGLDPADVTFLTAEQAQGGTTAGPTISLKGREQRSITGVQFDNVPVAPGALMNLVVKTKAGEQNVAAPVLTPELYYATISATTTSSTTTTSATTAPTSATATTGPGSTETAATGAAATSAATSGSGTTSVPTTTTTATTGG
jgi:hypothetical protein